MYNVNRVRGKDGKVRLYFRKAGMPSIPLQSPEPEEWEGSALKAEVDTLLAVQPTKAAPSTLSAALRRYELESPDFKVLADSTKYEYRLVLKELEEDFGALPVSRFTAEYILKLREVWAKRGHRAAEHRLLLLRHALLPSIIKANLDPFAMIPGVPRPRDAGEPHRIWPEGVVHAAIARALKEGKVGIARGVALGRYAGARRGDVVKLGRGARRNGRLAWLSGKRRVPVNIQEDAALTAVLDNTPNHPRSTILAYNLAGRAYSEDGLALELGKIITDLFTEGLIDSDDYTLHGLRHTFGVEAALAGCTDAEGASRMGHRSPHSFAKYRRQADRIRLSEHADVKLAQFRERTSNGALQNALQNICKTTPMTAAKPRGKNAAKSAI